MSADVAFIAQMIQELSAKLIEHAARGQVSKNWRRYSLRKWHRRPVHEITRKMRAPRKPSQAEISTSNGSDSFVTLHALAGFDQKYLACTDVGGWARFDSNCDDMIAAITLVRAGVITKDVLLRQVGGYLREGTIEIFHCSRNESGAASLGGKFLHPTLGGQSSHVGILVETGLHDVNLTIVTQGSLHRRVEIGATGRVLAIRNDHNDAAAGVGFQISTGLNDGIKQ